MATPEEVLDFWFGAAARSEAELLAKIQRWFAGGAAVDETIRERFGADVERALAGDLDAWAATPRGLLALVLVLDQFPRSIHRGSPRAFAGDTKALALVERALASGTERELDWEARQFLLMPFLHVENLASLEQALELFERTFAECPDLNKKVFAAGIEQAQKYRDVLRRFGRFPHRNEALERTSSAEELEFLKHWDQRAPPKIMNETVRGER